MHISLKLQLLHWLLFAFLSSIFAAVCFGADQNSKPPFDTQLLQLKDLWKSGNKSEYYQNAASMANNIASGSVNDPHYEWAAKLLEDLLTRKTTVAETRTADLSAMNVLALSLISDRNASVKERRGHVRLLSRYLGKVRKEIVPNYTPKPVTQNVSPPPGITPFGFSGMDPKTITDPVMRAKYEAAIQENQENSFINQRQSLLHKVEGEMSKSIINYMIDAFQTEDSSSPLIAECIKNARLTDAERKKVEHGKK